MVFISRILRISLVVYIHLVGWWWCGGVEGKTTKLQVPKGARVIPGQYIVTVRKKPILNLLQHLKVVKDLLKDDSAIGHILSGLGSGYIARLTKSQLFKVGQLEEVVKIEADTLVTLTATQSKPPSGLARLSSRSRPGLLNPPLYRHNPNDGQGVRVYIIDSGIDVRHPDFGGRAIWGKTMLPGSANVDENGHGTHVAGIVGSRTYGVAKGATMVGVKVFDAKGLAANSDIIAGIDWAVKDGERYRGSVINMSFGSGFSPALNRAAEEAVNKGFVVAAAAGNHKQDACYQSPASAKGVITVGATDIEDKRAEYSNYGLCVTLFAMGSRIQSTYLNGGTRVLSGTSMAAPHIAGVAAALRSRYQLTPSQTTSYILQLATQDVVTDPGAGSPNLLAYYDGTR